MKVYASPKFATNCCHDGICLYCASKWCPTISTCVRMISYVVIWLQACTLWSHELLFLLLIVVLLVNMRFSYNSTSCGYEFICFVFLQNSPFAHVCSYDLPMTYIAWHINSCVMSYRSRLLLRLQTRCRIIFEWLAYDFVSCLGLQIVAYDCVWCPTTTYSCLPSEFKIISSLVKLRTWFRLLIWFDILRIPFHMCAYYSICCAPWISLACLRVSSRALCMMNVFTVTACIPVMGFRMRSYGCWMVPHSVGQQVHMLCIDFIWVADSTRLSMIQ